MIWKRRGKMSGKKLAILILTCILLLFICGCNRTTCSPYLEILASGSAEAENLDPYWTSDTVDNPAEQVVSVPWLGGMEGMPGYTLKGTVLYVGQGSAAVFCSGGEYVIVDCGSSSGYEQNLIAFLKKLEPVSIKYLILTHWDVDHIASAKGVLQNFQVDTVIGSGYTLSEEFRTYTSLMGYISENAVPFIVPAAGSRYFFGDCEITFNGPVREYEDENSNSLSMIISDGKSSLYIGGDTTVESEKDIIGSGAELKSDIYICNHHGSSSSSCKAFIEAVSPEYTVISCGSGNDYGHPARTVLERIQDSGSALYRTDTQGDINFWLYESGPVFELLPTDNWEPGSSNGI